MADDAKKITDPKEMYQGLRGLMLATKRPRTIGEPSKSAEPWGLLMDWGVGNGTATVMSMFDGSASVYLSSGGGYIGGQGIGPVRSAAQKAVAEARLVQMPEHATADFPLPAAHEVFFYFLTDAGVYVLRTNETELSAAAHPLKKLGDAMQAVIEQFRLWKGRTKNDREKNVEKPN